MYRIYYNDEQIGAAKNLIEDIYINGVHILKFGTINFFMNYKELCEIFESQKHKTFIITDEETTCKEYKNLYFTSFDYEDHLEKQSSSQTVVVKNVEFKSIYNKEKPVEPRPYGKELILDLHNCDRNLFNRRDIEVFFIDLCRVIDMQRCDLHFWDYKGQQDDYYNVADHLKGTSAIQFITTSNVTIHTLDVLKAVYLNIFTCKDFNPEIAAEFCADYFKAETFNSTVVDRL